MSYGFKAGDMFVFEDEYGHPYYECINTVEHYEIYDTLVCDNFYIDINRDTLDLVVLNINYTGSGHTYKIKEVWDRQGPDIFVRIDKSEFSEYNIITESGSNRKRKK